MSIEGSGASRGGGDGTHNEDAFLVDSGLGLYVVCDGASDAPGGEVAARVAAKALDQFVELAEQDLDLRSLRVAREIVEQAMHHALGAVVEAEHSDPALRGLETTTTALVAHGSVGVIGHRGDSRAYLIRRERVSQLTVDHDLTRSVAESGNGGRGFDVFSVDLKPGDTIVLCTDGAEEVVRDDAIVRVAGDLSPRLLASRIVGLSHQRAPESDATVVVVRVRGAREKGWLELSLPPSRTAFGHTLELA